MSSRKLKLTSLFLLVCLFWAHSAIRAEWIKDGVPICSSSGDQWYGYIASDGAGGAIVTWWEYRTAGKSADVFAQRLDSDGNILWSPDGVPICTASGAQADPQIIADGSGGAIISWRDARSGDYDIYAQRIDATGNVQWKTDGIGVCIAAYGQYEAGILPDGRGNFIIAWRDDRSGYGQVYCQKLDGDGNALWTSNGIRVCSTLYWEDDPKIISDTRGGAILIWHDERYSIVNSFIYAQRIDGNGTKLWDPGGAPIDLSGGLKWERYCVPDGHGGGIVSWRDDRTGGENVYAQRFDSTGAILWVSGGVPVCTAVNDQIGPSIAPDDLGGAIVAWLDNRDGRDDIYAQRVLADGNMKWHTDGVMIHKGPLTSGFGYSFPDIVRDENGGAILTWQEGPGAPDLWDILAQRVDAEGSLLWPDSAVSVCRAPGGQYFPRMTTNGENGAIITWRDMRNGAQANGAVYAMRVTDSGETVATLLQNYSAHVSNSSFITIEWTLSEVDSDAQFAVLRCEAKKTDYEELIGAEIQRSGLSFTYVDKACEPGKSYRYRVDVSDSRGRRVLFETDEIALPPLPFALFQNYPNPFNPSTTISYYVPSDCQVTLDIYDSSGKLISKLLDRENKPAGKDIAEWRGVDDQGRPVSSGVYFYKLQAGKESISKKMVLLK